MPICPDPHYLSSPALWLRSQVLENYGLRVEALDGLPVRSFSDLRDGLLGVRSGLDFDTFHWTLAQACGRQILERFGPAIAPIPGVIPIQRGRRPATVYDRFGWR